MNRRDVLALPIAALPLLAGETEYRPGIRFVIVLEPGDVKLQEYRVGVHKLLSFTAPGLLRKAAAAFRNLVRLAPTGNVVVKLYEDGMRPWAGSGGEDSAEWLIEAAHLFPDGKFKEGKEKVLERAAHLCFAEHRGMKTEPLDVSLVPKDWSVNDYLLRRVEEETRMKREVIPRLRFVQVDVLG